MINTQNVIPSQCGEASTPTWNPAIKCRESDSKLFSLLRSHTRWIPNQRTLLACLFGMTLSSVSLAQTPELAALFDKADWDKTKVIDCKGAPKDAITAVPKELAGYARVICTKTGHHFVAKRGWHWHHQAEGIPKFFVSAGSSLAQNGVIPEGVDHKAYFTKIAVARVNYGANFGKMYPAQLAQNPVLLAAHQEMSKANVGALQVSLTTKNGETMVMHVLDRHVPYSFAYVTTIPGTAAVVLMNDLTKVQQAQKQLQPKK